MKTLANFIAEANTKKSYAKMSEDEKEDHIDKLMNKGFNHQHTFIKKHCGKQAADRANYGHGIGGDDNYTSLGTKVYGHGYLTTNINHHTGEIEHDWDG